MSKAKFVAISKDDLLRTLKYSALDMYLYSGIRNITEYSGAFYGDVNNVMHYFNLTDLVSVNDIVESLVKLKHDNLIEISKPDTAYIIRALTVPTVATERTLPPIDERLLM